MDASRGLVTKLCDEGGLLEVQRSGITPDFLDDDSAPILNYIQRHFTEYKSVPSRGAVKEAFPDYEFMAYKEPLDYFIDQIKEHYRRAILEEQIGRIGSVYTSDTKKAEQVLRDALASLQVTSQTHRDVNVAETAVDRYELYEKRKTEPPEDGILSGWPSLDYQTLGFHPEEFAVLVGEKWVGKSWKMLWLAFQALIQNERVLFLTQEMSPTAVIKRLDSIYAGVRFDALRRGELTDDEEARYKLKMEEFRESDYNLTVAREGVSTIDDIETKAVETDATIVFADSVYLFAPDSKSNYSGETAKRLLISQKCKRIARNLEVPFIVSVQAGRKKGNKDREPDLDDIEWSNAFSQDADTVFFVEKRDLDVELMRRKMYLLKSRDGDAAQFFTDADFEYMQFKEREGDTDEPTTSIEFEDEEEVLNYE